MKRLIGALLAATAWAGISMLLVTCRVEAQEAFYSSTPLFWLEELVIMPAPTEYLYWPSDKRIYHVVVDYGEAFEYCDRIAKELGYLGFKMPANLLPSQRLIGCSITHTRDPNSCTVVYPAHDAHTYWHEIAHCNGWKHD